MNGVLVVDKPGGMTSHDVVNHVRKMFSNIRAGHLGTLDPMATGVLPICLGKATRISQFLPSSPKEYVGEIRFGFATTTYDREGEPVGVETDLAAGRDEVLKAMAELTGGIDQVPPPYSAKRIAGVRSYKLARRGHAVENAPVRVDVAVFELKEFCPPTASFRVVCSAGTYVRSLAHDLGQKLGCGGHLLSLRRLQSGPFGIDQAARLDRITAIHIIPLERLLEEWPLIEVSGIDEHKVAHGNAVRSEADAGLARIFNKQGEFLAVAAVESGWARPRVVLTSKASVE